MASADGTSTTGIVAAAGKPDGEIPRGEDHAACFHEGDGLANKVDWQPSRASGP
jgi:hypothetical protein